MHTARSWLLLASWLTRAATAAASVVLPDPGMPDTPIRMRELWSLLLLRAGRRQLGILRGVEVGLPMTLCARRSTWAGVSSPAATIVEV